MINTLSAINENKTISAKELYAFLELSPSNYARWTKRNIVGNRFAMEGIDYVQSDRNVKCGRYASTSYRLFPNFAKKICMISRSAKGNLARNYFIEVEKRYRKMTNQIFSTPQCLAISEADRAIAYFTKLKEIKQLAINGQ